MIILPRQNSLDFRQSQFRTPSRKSTRNSTTTSFVALAMQTFITRQIGADGFRGLINIAAAAPRKFGFATNDAAMHGSVDERRAARANLFSTIDADGSGLISFEEFLGWAMSHIAAKIAEGVKTHVYLR